jgi:hypothetical protein
MPEGINSSLMIPPVIACCGIPSEIESLYTISNFGGCIINVTPLVVAQPLGF